MGRILKLQNRGANRNASGIKDCERNNWRIFTPLTLPSPRRGEGAADSYSFRGPKRVSPEFRLRN